MAALFLRLRTDEKLISHCWALTESSAQGAVGAIIMAWLVPGYRCLRPKKDVDAGQFVHTQGAVGRTRLPGMTNGEKC